jgi:RecA-family ATPase
MTLFDRARAYVAKMDAAVSGSGGHDATFQVACALVWGFDLPEHDARALLAEYNARCSPPWSERELEHKLQSAMNAKHEKPRGHLRGEKISDRRFGAGVPEKLGGYPNASKPKPAAKISPPKIPPAHDAAELPKPIADSARELLRAAFVEGENVCICPAELNDDGREIPESEGTFNSREEWLRKLDAAKGNPNGIFSSSKRTGIFIRVNPIKPGRGHDADVQSYRHALFESDEISKVEQFHVLSNSRLPITALIDSGGKSIHAWVKLDAASRAEYDERRNIVEGYLAEFGFKFDAKNKNPSRFSRLPNCVRFGSRQELLGLRIGAGSYTEWLAEVSSDELGKCLTVEYLSGLDTRNDPNCIIGWRENESLRYICRGKSLWLLGPSGIGKSSIISEFAVAWACGKSCWGIAPPPGRKLKTLIIQAENDDYDLAEIVQGIVAGQGLTEFGREDDLEAVRENLIFKTETRAVGDKFIERLQRLIDRERPDIIVIDPALSFMGIDVNKQTEATIFLREKLNPVLESTGAVFFGVHHTGKPKSAKETANWTAVDYAYAGLGSSEMVNWARAVMFLKPHGNGVFELKLAKRGTRAGAVHPDGTWTTEIWLEHAKKGIKWNQIPPPEKPEKESGKPGRPNETAEIAAMNLHEFTSACTGDEGKNAIAKRLEIWLAKQKKDVSLATCKRILPLLVANGKLAKSEDSTYKKGPNA